MDAKLAEIKPRVQRQEAKEILFDLLSGEALLIPKIPTDLTHLFDAKFVGATKDPISGAVLRTKLTYVKQRLIMEESKIIPNGYFNNFMNTTRALQMYEEADPGPNLVSVACKITDPGARQATLSLIQGMYPGVSCECPAYY